MEINKVIISDCFEYMKTMPDKCVDVSFTSPPYNRVRNDTYEYFDDINNDYLDMLNTLTEQLLRITRKDVIINVQQNMCNKKEFFSWLGTHADKIKGSIVWEKTNPQPNKNYREKDETYSITNAYENFFVFNNDNKEFRANTYISNVIRTPVNSEHFEGHGAVMRLDVAEFFITNFSKKKDIVFDPFFGCGTTGVACVRNDRNYLGCELIEHYAEMAKKRIKQESQQLAFNF